MAVSVTRGGKRTANFELQKNKAGKWFWHFRAANNEIVAVSEAYESKEGAQHGVEVMRREAGDAAMVVLG